MNPAELALLIRAIDGLLTLGINAGVAVEKLIALKAASATGTVTDEQIQQLAKTARTNVGKL